VVSDLRNTIAVGIALLVTAFTLGFVRVNWTGEPGADSGGEDPGRAAVSRSLDPDLGPGTDGSPARLRITLADGQAIEQFMEHSSGSRGKPMTQMQIDAKFLDCAAQIMPDDAGRKILAALKAFPEQKSLDEFWPLLRKA
jgi:hypothetical protein